MGSIRKEAHFPLKNILILFFIPAKCPVLSVVEKHWGEGEGSGIVQARPGLKVAQHLPCVFYFLVIKPCTEAILSHLSLHLLLIFIPLKIGGEAPFRLL